MYDLKYLLNIIQIGLFSILVYSCPTAIVGQAQDGLHKPTQQKRDDWTVKDHIKRFSPANILERIEKMHSDEGKVPDATYIDTMLNSLDETDYFLNLKVPKFQVSRRNRPKDQNPFAYNFDIGSPRDTFRLRARITSLMQHAIYQARDAMQVMQNMRKKYSKPKDPRVKLYKMGFLMCKTDNTVKTYSKFALRAYKLCQLTHDQKAGRMHPYGVMVVHEKILHLLFQSMIMIDLVKKNDASFRKTLENFTQDRLLHWPFED